MGALSVFFLMGILSTLFLIFVSLFIGILCTYVVGYLFEGFLVSSLLDTKNYRGWIPFYNKYLLGNITGDHVLGIISSICAFPVLIIGYVLFVMDELNYLLFVVFLVILIIGFIVDHINLPFLSACGSKAHIVMNNSCLCRHLILYFN